MMISPVEIWLSKMEKRHSSSKNTERLYRGSLERFCNFIGETPEQIVEEWKNAKYDLRKRERFIDETLEKVDIYENHLGKQGLCKSSVATYLAGVASFFKYMRIPAKIDVYVAAVKYHNRDISKEEIKRILNNASPRDRAFFLMMLQSGLRPVTLLQLTYGQIKEDFEKKRVPCAIIVERRQTKGEYIDHLTFISDDAVKALEAYFRERGIPKDNEQIFKGVQTPNAFSMRFGYWVRERKLIAKEKMRAEGKPQPLRLYCLRKYFRNKMYAAGPEFVNFWMGHKINYKAPQVPSSDAHYFSHDLEHNRKVYAEHMHNLRIFEPSPRDTEKTIKELQQKIAKLERERSESQKTREELENLKNKYDKLSSTFENFARTISTLRYDPEKKMLVSTPFEPIEPDWVSMARKAEPSKIGHRPILVKPSDVDKWREKGWKLSEEIEWVPLTHEQKKKAIEESLKKHRKNPKNNP